MDLIVDARLTSRKRKNRLQKRFDKLCRTLEIERKQSARFRNEIDELVQTFERRMMANNQANFDKLVALSEKLIKFASRKSLANWHRRELAHWVEELIERRIARIDQAVAGRLRLDYRQAIASSMDITVDELDKRYAAIDEEFESLFDDEDTDARVDSADDVFAESGPWQDDLFGFDDVDIDDLDIDDVDWTAEGFETNFDANDDDWMPDEAKQPRTRQSIMDGSWANSLFRRAAQVLHPDRESDPEQREIKQELMRELLTAREQGDIFTLLSIYSENVSGKDIVLAEQEMTDVCEALEEQLEVLQLEKHAYVYAHPARLMVFEIFYDGSKKVRNERMREWEQELTREKAELHDLIGYLRNLACLKQSLRDRRRERAVIVDGFIIDEFEF